MGSWVLGAAGSTGRRKVELLSYVFGQEAAFSRGTSASWALCHTPQPDWKGYRATVDGDGGCFVLDSP